MDNADPSVQRGIVRQLFKKIRILKDNRIEVQWNIPCDLGGQGFVKENKWGHQRPLNRQYRPPSEVSSIIDFFYEPEVLTRDFLHQKYVVEGLSCAEISRSVASSRTTILKRLNECKIPIREVGSNQKRKRGVAFGQRVQKMQTLAHKRELEVIEKMKRLRDQGHSYRQVAEILNAIGTPTKTRKGKWHGKSVYQILNKSKSA